MKKIKSVKIKDVELKEGVLGNWLFPDCDFPVFSSEQIERFPNAFEIEYESERKYIDVRIEYDNLEGSFGTLKMEVENIGSALRSMFRPDFNFKITKLTEGNYENPA